MSTTAVTPQATQTSNVNVMAANDQARRLLVRRAVEMTQEIYSNTVTPTNTQIINVVPRNVGIIKRFIIEVNGTVTNNGDTQADLMANGVANLVSNITFYDLQNNLRINTDGAHLYMLSSMKRQRLWLAATGLNDPIYFPDQIPAPGGVLNSDNDPIFVASPTLAPAATGNVRMFFEVPLAYSDEDLRGAVFANVVNTTMNLQVTLNSQLATSSEDVSNVVYRVPESSVTVNVSFDSATITIYQVYLDQLPSASNGQLILPNIDLATVYQITNTTLTGITANQDYPIAFANFRDFFSVFVYYWNGDIAADTTDEINYFSLTTANFTNIYKYDVFYARAMMRDTLKFNLPPHWFYFSSRRHPIWTTQFGNQQINVNASQAGQGAYLKVMWEAMALQNTLVGSASLPAGG